MESIRKTDLGKQIYAQRKETIERVFADAKEKHAMRYTHHRGLAAVTRWVRLKFAAMNLKNWPNGVGRTPCSRYYSSVVAPSTRMPPLSLIESEGYLTD